VPDPQTIARNLEQVRAALEQSARRAGRDPRGVAVMAVTKSFSLAEVQAACSAGLRLFGENRVQEAEAKYGLQAPSDGAGPPTGLPGRPGLPPLSLHLIGHLQRNKARKAAELFDAVDSIDKLETARALEAACAAAGRRLDILLEMNTSGEPTKFGFAGEEELEAAVEPILGLPHLRLRGLMTVGPLTAEREQARAAFRRLARLFERLRERCAGQPLEVLSMGMSGDFETAVEEGSTLVRLGTALFGPRGSP
jgi:pyridoxal phosphate enzyme (YggS family)